MEKSHSNSVCRACLTALIETAGHYLFDEMQLADKFASCSTLPKLNQEEAADEFLPKLICNSCKDKLNEFYEFQVMCLASDKYLRSLDFRVQLPHNFDEDEKPVYDLEIQNGLAIVISEANVLTDALSKQQQTNVKLVKKKRGRPPKEKKCNLAEVDSETKLENVILNQDNTTFIKNDKTAAAIYKCELCTMRFFAEHRLIAHKRVHDGLTAYPCTHDGCEKGFNRKQSLNEHLQQEHEGKQRHFACDQNGCDKVYKHKPTLVMHLRRFHKVGPELKSHVCEICGKIFKSSAILNDHRYIHYDKSELPMKCNEKDCQQRFSNREKLKVHMLRHAGIKNFICPYCGMRKTTRNELKIHINYHTLERTWPCRFCTKVCNSAGNLKMHVRTVHERAKDYACRYCERTFGKPDTRKYHEMTHTGEKPHECNVCGKRFTQPAALRTHRKIHAREQNQIARAPETAGDTVNQNDNLMTLKA